MDKEILEVLKSINSKLGTIEQLIALQYDNSKNFYGLYDKDYYKHQHENHQKIAKLMDDQNGILGSIRYTLGIWTNEMNKPDAD